MTKSFDIKCAGYAIKADWYAGKSTDRVLLILKGFMSTRFRQADFTKYMVEATGASALTIDLSGHGESPFELKDTRPAQHVIEVMYAYEWIERTYPDAKITVIGNSYGSFLAAHLSMYKNIDTLVLRAPAIYKPESLYDLWSLRFEDEDAYRISITKYRTNSDALKNHPLFVRTAALPTLVVVHENDEVIPVETSDAFIRGFNADTFVAEGFKHAVSQSPISNEQLLSYQKHIADWINKQAV